MFDFRPAPKPAHKRRKLTAKERGAVTPAVYAQLLERARGHCERCGRNSNAGALQAAHLVRRWKLIETTVNDLALLCIGCHQWADSCSQGREWLEQNRKRLYGGDSP